MTEIRIGAHVIVTEHDIDAMGRDTMRLYHGVVIGVNYRRRWVLVAYRVGGACLRGGFMLEDIKILEDVR